jgi:nickel-dependent lactate racemase
MLALDFETGQRRSGVGTGLLEGNAIHEECEEVAAMVRISFAVNAIVDERGRAVKVYAGDWKEAHRVGCLEYLVDHSITIEAKRDLVVVSCGGLPYDINLIQAHKALDMAALACNEGGTIVFIAECRDGLGRPDFMKWFDHGSSAELAKRLRNEYEVNGQTAWSLFDKTERYRVIMVSSLPAEEVRLLNMTPSKTLADALGEAQETEGFIMPRGTAFLPLAAGS